MPVTIEFIDGPFPPSRRSVSLECGESIQIGRLPPCDLFVSDPSVSGKHFSLLADANHVRIKDLGSRNGTRINGRKTSVAEIGDGDEIRIGKTLFRISISNGANGRSVTPLNGVHIENSVSDASLSVSRTVAMPLTVTLLVKPGAGEEDEIRIRNGQTVVIGASPSADFSFANSSLRSRHFRIECDKNTCNVRCFSKRTPILVNGEPVFECQLYDDDVLVAGNAEFRVALDGDLDLVKRPEANAKTAAPARTPSRSRSKLPKRFQADVTAVDFPLTNAFRIDGATIERPVTELLHGLGASLHAYLLVDFFRMRQQGLPSKAQEQYRISSGSPGGVGAYLIPIESKEQLEDWSSKIEGSDCGFLMFSLLDLAEFRDKVCAVTVNGKPVCDICWPSVMRVVLSSGNSSTVDGLVEAIQYSVIETSTPGQWSIYCNQQRMEALSKFGMTVTVKDKNTHPPESQNA